MLGLATAPLQMASGFARPVFELTIARAPGAHKSAAPTLETATRPTAGSEMLQTGAELRSAGAATNSDAPIVINEIDDSRSTVAFTADDWPAEFIGNGEVDGTAENQNAEWAAEGDQETASTNSFASGIRVAASRMALLGASILAVFVAGGLARVALHSVQLRRRLASCRPLARGCAPRLLKQLQRRAGLRRSVRLLSSGEFAEPVALGLWRWTIVLPDGIETQVGKDELQSLLAHELAHLARGDVVWLWIGRLLCSGLAFQPLHFIARRRWRRAAELLCDDWAIDRGARSLALARGLTRIAERRLDAQPCAAVLGAVGFKATLAERVERLVEQGRRPDPWARTARQRGITLLAAGLGILFACWAPRAVWPGVVAVTKAESTTDSSIDVGPARRDDWPSPTEWKLLDEQLTLLHRDLDRADELLMQRSDAIQFGALPAQMRRRAAAVERRRVQLAAASPTDVSSPESFSSENKK